MKDGKITVKWLRDVYRSLSQSNSYSSWVEIDGNVCVTDTGYAFEGMEIFLDVVERRIKEEI